MLLAASRPARAALLGVSLWSLGMLLGGYLLSSFISHAFFGLRPPSGLLMAMLIGAAVSFPACAVYLRVPVTFDRYAPEPWWCLAMVLLWGAIPAAGFSGWLNASASSSLQTSGFERQVAQLLGAVAVAPVVEEALKGAAVVGVFVFLRHEFDGVVDGVVYATFVALGFAATENALYYARSWQREGWEGMTGLFVVRGVLAPWGHPLYTAMFGLGVGYARETSERWRQVLAPLVGFFAAVALHAAWNGMAELLDNEHVSMRAFQIAFPAMLSVWLMFVAMFGALVVWLVRRERGIIREHLEAEVELGSLTREELEQVCSPVKRLGELLKRRDARESELVSAASRLALARWHDARAGQAATPEHDAHLDELRRALVEVRETPV